MMPGSPIGAAAKPPTINDTPSQHGMFMLGTTELFLCHMPMFTMEDHAYQLVVRAHLDVESAATVAVDRAAHPEAAHNLINLADDLFTLPMIKTGDVTTYRADIYRNYSNADGGSPTDRIVNGATVAVDNVVYYRHFSASAARPARLSYLLFGAGDEAHLSHVIAVDPDYQHLLSIRSPDGLDSVELRAGVMIEFDGTDGSITPCGDPLTAGLHSVLYDGDPARTLDLVIDPTASRWFSTGNLLNAHDPCAK